MTSTENFAAPAPQAQRLEAPIQGARETLNLTELSRGCGISEDELEELVDYGALVPLAADTQEIAFRAEACTRLRTVSGLRQEFGLDVFTGTMLLDYLARIELLERQVRALQGALQATLQNRPVQPPGYPSAA